jgi:hypothetical protein
LYEIEIEGVTSFTFDMVDPCQPDDPLNSSKDNRYLTAFFANRSDGDLDILAERN